MSKKIGKVTEKKARELITSDLYDKLKAKLNDTQFIRTRDYISSGQPSLLPVVETQLYEEYISGLSLESVLRNHKDIPSGAVYWAYALSNWEEERLKYLELLHEEVKKRLIISQSETIGMFSNMLMAAVRTHGEKYRIFLETNDESALEGAVEIKTLTHLLQVIDGIQKVTGQDRIHKFKTEDTKSASPLDAPIASGGQPSTPKGLDAESAAQLLEILAEAKRKKDGR